MLAAVGGLLILAELGLAVAQGPPHGAALLAHGSGIAIALSIALQGLIAHERALGRARWQPWLRGALYATIAMMIAARGIRSGWSPFDRAFAVVVPAVLAGAWWWERRRRAR